MQLETVSNLIDQISNMCHSIWSLIVYCEKTIYILQILQVHGHEQDCVHMSHKYTKQWGDITCQANIQYICEQTNITHAPRSTTISNDITTTYINNIKITTTKILISSGSGISNDPPIIERTQKNNNTFLLTLTPRNISSPHSWVTHSTPSSLSKLLTTLTSEVQGSTTSHIGNNGTSVDYFRMLISISYTHLLVFFLSCWCNEIM